ncbi:MAG: formate dehydrogenase accessory protein FdhE [Rhodopila sp.]|jgi:FdhE protein
MARGRRSLPPRGFSDIQPDPSRVGGVAEAPFVRLPDPATLFAARARRLVAVAKDHPMAAYLDFLAGVVAAQAGCVVARPPPAPVPAQQVVLRAAHGFPPISYDQIRGNADFAATLEWLLDHVVLDAAPAAARAAVASVRGMAEAERFDLATDIQDGACSADLVAESLFVGAALQVHLAALAAQLDAAAVASSAMAVCPVCGGAPVSSVVVGWTQANKARYCACGLCGTLWNHVRIRCTACGATQGIAYYTIEDGPKTIGIETCTACRCYIKHMQQHENPELDPLVDDVASYALDLLARDRDFRRSSLNPLFLTC